MELNDVVFNEVNWNDVLLIKGRDHYKMIVQLYSEGGVDYTVYDGNNNEVDGGIYEDDEVTYKDLFEFDATGKFDELSTVEEYID